MSARDKAAELMAAHGMPVEQHSGQLRMAHRLVARYRDRLRYVYGIGWHEWDGVRWKRDDSGAATRAATDTIKAAFSDLADLDREGRQDLLRDIRRCESASGLEGMLRIAASMLPFATAIDQLDADPYLLNVANGTLDLRTLQVRPHDPADLLTKVAGCGYDPEGQAPRFEQFLAEILPDAAIRGYVARVLGHALPGQVLEHVLAIFTGTGQNGKSTLIEVAGMAAFGDYAMAAEPDLLVDRGAVHTTGQADLLGVRLAVCSETDEGRKLAAATVKRLTGGDKVRARRMRQDNIEFTPSHTVLMVTNHKPKVAGDDPALWRRLRIVPFDVVVANPDKRLRQQLELELPGILRWLVDGYRDWNDNGLDEPASVTAATEAYRATSDALGRFLDECVHQTPFGTVKARELFGLWSSWCHENGETPGSEVTFAEAMSQRGLKKTKRNGVQTYIGLMLLDSSEAAS